MTETLDRDPAKEHNWFNVTTWADRDWELAKARFWEMWAAARYEPERLKAAEQALAAARADYRTRVLSWHFKLNVPMQPGECVPTSVAELLAEAWDIGELRWWA